MFSKRDISRAVKVLKNARKLIIEYGWVQGRSGNIKYGFCAYGAMSASTKSSYLLDLARGIFEGVIKNSDNTISWNDSPSRRKKAVIAAFDRAIKRYS